MIRAPLLQTPVIASLFLVVFLGGCGSEKSDNETEGEWSGSESEWGSGDEGSVFDDGSDRPSSNDTASDAAPDERVDSGAADETDTGGVDEDEETADTGDSDETVGTIPKDVDTGGDTGEDEEVVEGDEIPGDDSGEATVETDDTGTSADELDDEDPAFETPIDEEDGVSERDTADTEDTATPVDTATPDDTATPGDTATPEDTATPDDTATPEDTAPPVDTATPEDTAKPEDTAEEGDTGFDIGTEETGSTPEPGFFPAEDTGLMTMDSGLGEPPPTPFSPDCKHPFNPIDETGWQKTYTATFIDDSAGLGTATAIERGLGTGYTSFGAPAFKTWDKLTTSTGKGWEGSIYHQCDESSGTTLSILEWNMSLTFDEIPGGSATALMTLSSPRMYLTDTFAIGTGVSWDYSYNLTYVDASGSMPIGISVPVSGSYIDQGMVIIDVMGEAMEAWHIKSEYTMDLLTLPALEAGFTRAYPGVADHYWVEGIGLVYERHVDTGTGAVILEKKLIELSSVPEEEMPDVDTGGETPIFDTAEEDTGPSAMADTGDDGLMSIDCAHPFNPVDRTSWEKTYTATFIDDSDALGSAVAKEQGMGIGYTSSGMETFKTWDTLTTSTGKGWEGSVYHQCDDSSGTTLSILEWNMMLTFDEIPGGTSSALMRLSSPRMYLTDTFAIGTGISWSFSYNLTFVDTAASSPVPIEISVPVSGTYTDRGLIEIDVMGEPMEAWHIQSEYSMDLLTIPSLGDGVSFTRGYPGFANYYWVEGIGLVYEKHVDIETGATILQKTLTEMIGL